MCIDCIDLLCAVSQMTLYYMACGGVAEVCSLGVADKFTRNTNT
jgi:hypothetical protein